MEPVAPHPDHGLVDVGDAAEETASRSHLDQVGHGAQLGEGFVRVEEDSMRGGSDGLVFTGSTLFINGERTESGVQVIEISEFSVVAGLGEPVHS